VPAAKLTLCPVLRSPGSVTARHSSSGHHPMFAAWYNFTRNGITELSQRAPPIFVRAAITLALSHILVFLLSSFFPRLISAVGDWMSTILPHNGVALVRIYSVPEKNSHFVFFGHNFC